MSVSTRRLVYANRTQGEWRDESLDALLPPEHSARDVWEFVVGLDVTPLLAGIRALPGSAGAPAIDPRILLALWLYATVQGIGSSRRLAELCENHLAYRWLCGGVSVCYHTLSDFRTSRGEYLDQVLTQTVAVLMHEGLVDLQRVAQDGMRVRAAAGASSFHRQATMERCLEEAQSQVEALQAQTDEDAGAASRREEAARKRAATDRVSRLEAAQRELQHLREANAGRPASRQVVASELRVSTTDPEARKMKMPDGGFRPGYNVQFATTTTSGVIVGVDVTNAGTDTEQMSPMLAQIEERHEQAPAEMLVDGGFVSLEAITQAEENGTKVYAPIKDEKKKLAAGQDPYQRGERDTAGTAEWRARMGTAEAKTIYKERASTAEWANAHARNRGLYRVAVRGCQKVLTVVLWYVLAHNFQRMQALRASRAATAAAEARGMAEPAS
jgi:transposase